MLPKPRAQPVSTPLQGGLRFFPPLYPHCHWLTLRPPYLSCRNTTGLPRSARLTRTGEVLSVRRERWLSMTSIIKTLYPLRSLCASLSASLACRSSRRLSRVHMCSPYHPSSPVRLMLADTPFPHGSGASPETGYRVRGLCTGRYLSAHPRRILLMEQQVLSHTRQTINFAASCRSDKLSYMTPCKVQYCNRLSSDSRSRAWTSSSFKNDCDISLPQRGQCYPLQ